MFTPVTSPLNLSLNYMKDRLILGRIHGAWVQSHYYTVSEEVKSSHDSRREV